MQIRRSRQSPEQVEKILKQRLESKLSKLKIVNELGCWLYTGPLNRTNGYGRTTYKAKGHNVHRLSAYLYLGLSLDSPLQANHKPICPNKHCFNPEHLYVGDQSQNQLDVSRGDMFPCGHSRSSENTYTYKKYKWCRLCRNKSRNSSVW